MSGICGIFNLDCAPVDECHLRAMITMIGKRGPDRTGQLQNSSIAFGHTLLETTPELTFESQPFLHRESGCMITADVRLDNRVELLSALDLLDRHDNIGDAELTAGELRSRGYYLGSNVSYNLKKLVDAGYIHHERSSTDRRSVRVRLTEKGKEVCDVVNNLYERQLGSLEQVGGISGECLETLNQSLLRMERFWGDQIRYRL